MLQRSPQGVATHALVRDAAGRVADHRFLGANRAFLELVGEAPARLLGRLASEVWTVSPLGPLEGLLERAVRASQAVEYEHWSPELGRHLRIEAFSIGSDACATIVTDHTRQHHIEQQLEQLVAALDQAGESILLADAAGRIEFVNQAFVAITGYRETEALGQLPWELLDAPPEAGDRDQAPVWHRILGRERWAGRAVKRRKDGTLVQVESTSAAVRGEDGTITHYVIIDRDITANLELEARLSQATKMEAIGQLAGGMAHDFNNMMTVIAGHGELLAETLREDGLLARSPAAAGDLRQIDEAVHRAVVLTRRLLTFSRRETSQPRVVGLNDVVSGLQGFLRRLLGEAIEVRLDLADELGNVKVDPAQIEQVIMNLAVNARDAMNGRGRLSLVTSGVDLDDDYAAQHPEVVPGRHVRLTVADEGCGMDAATRQRIFEPFFTTKSAGEGTGLGLAVVHGIVGQNQGHIQCYSELGQGSAFNVYFPVVDEAPRDIAVPEATGLLRGDECILLVEDDHALRKLTARTLASAGYEVIVAASGEQALAVTRQPDLLVTDLTLGDTDGLAVMAALTARWPGLRTLCISGYPLSSLGERIDISAIPHFLTKPFSPAQFRETVRDILDA